MLMKLSFVGFRLCLRSTSILKSLTSAQWRWPPSRWHWRGPVSALWCVISPKTFKIMKGLLHCTRSFETSLKVYIFYMELSVNSFILLPFSQIIGRGNDQVALSSKFETREDFGLYKCLHYSLFKHDKLVRYVGHHRGSVEVLQTLSYLAQKRKQKKYLNINTIPILQLSNSVYLTKMLDATSFKAVLWNPTLLYCLSSSCDS